MKEPKLNSSDIDESELQSRKEKVMHALMSQIPTINWDGLWDKTFIEMQKGLDEKVLNTPDEELTESGLEHKKKLKEKLT